MDEGPNLAIIHERVSPTQTKLTAKLDGTVVYVDKIDLSKPRHRSCFADELCKGRPNLLKKDIESCLLQLAAKVEEPSQEPSPPSREELIGKTPDFVLAEARATLEDPKLCRRILDDIQTIGAAGEQELSLTIYLVGTSRLLRKPLAAIVQGPSSSGKSYVVERVASLFPPEGVLNATQMTPQSLFYLKPGSLKNRFVVAGERSRVEDDETAEATRALREMLSGGRLSKLVPVKGKDGMETRLIEQEGPIAFVESTTLTKIFDEDLNRCILLTTDERQSQTRRIIDSIAAKYMTNGSTSRAEQIVSRHNTMQRLIEPLEVLVPYAGRLAEKFVDDRVEARRAFPQVLSLIQSSALLHQYQRQRDNDGHVLADRHDYEIARRLVTGPLSRQLGGNLSDPARRFFDKLAPLFGDAQFTAAEAVAKTKAGKRSAYGWLSELNDAGVVKIVESQHGPKPAVWQIIGSADDVQGPTILPPAEQVFPS
jgi:hypothetical protein